MKTFEAICSLCNTVPPSIELIQTEQEYQIQLDKYSDDDGLVERVAVVRGPNDVGFDDRHNILDKIDDEACRSMPEDHYESREDRGVYSGLNQPAFDSFFNHRYAPFQSRRMRPL